MTEFPADRFFVRVRRLADLSQRDLAERIGVASSTVAKVESGQRVASLTLLTRALDQAALRLAVVDAAGAVVDPVPDDVVRDNADRRFPAHLDVDPPDLVPRQRRLMPRYDRPPAKGWYQLREQRDATRDIEGVADDHPTVEGLAQRNAEIRRARLRLIIATAAAAPPRPELECTCDTPCWLGAACVPECTCQCETGGLERPVSGDPD